MRRLETLTAIVAFVAAFTLAFAAAPKVAQAISCGDTISVDTTLTADLGLCPGDGLIIDPGVTLDCDGFTVTGTGTDAGILLTGVSGVTVENCFVDNFAINIHLSSSSGNLIKNNEVTGGTTSSGGIRLTGSDGNILVKNTAENNSGRGFELASDSDGNHLVDNTAKLNVFRGFGINGGSDGNVLQGNKAMDNDSAGFVVSTSTGNILHKNKAKNSQFEGFAILSSGNVLVENRADKNTTFGIRDTGGNVYIGNKCKNNDAVTNSSPAGLDPPGCI